MEGEIGNPPHLYFLQIQPPTLGPHPPFSLLIPIISQNNVSKHCIQSATTQQHNNQPTQVQRLNEVYVLLSIVIQNIVLINIKLAILKTV